MFFDFRKNADKEFIEGEIARFRACQRRRAMLCGEDYFAGRQDILNRKRTVIGENGELETVYNLPDNKAVDNQYAKLVNQKTNYLLGRPLTFRTDDAFYYSKLAKLFDKNFLRLMKNVAKAAYNHGISWIYPFLEDGVLRFKRLNGYEVIAGWRDFEHTILDYAIRVYEVADYSQKLTETADEKIIEKVEVFDEDGISYFELESDKLIPVSPFYKPYITAVGEDFIKPRSWGKIPLISFKRDQGETPLINSVKSLQDGLNLILSNFWNSMEEDPRNTLMVLVNYDGENLSEFRKNLAAYGVVKVRTVDGAAGDLKTLRVEVNAENYKTIISVFKKAIIENGMGFDARETRGFGSGSPNQMSVQSMYSDIDLDANEIETEFQASLSSLIEIIAKAPGFEKYSGENVEFIFNRDMMLNESAVIDNCIKSAGILSRETIIANHPWVNDARKEINGLPS